MEVTTADASYRRLLRASGREALKFVEFIERRTHPLANEIRLVAILALGEGFQTSLHTLGEAHL
jgi:hypothetical protein